MNSEMLILHLMQSEGIGPRTLAGLLRQLDARGRSAEYLLEAPHDELVDCYRLPADLAERAAAEQEPIGRLRDEIERHAVRMVLLGSDEYPQMLVSSLDTRTPPVLFVWGEMSLPAGPSAAVCGARKVSPRGQDAASAIAGRLAEAGINVVSGQAVGVDRAAHSAALEAGGVTTAVLPTGILRFFEKAAAPDDYDPARLLVISEFHPRQTWTAWAAMQRNSTVAALCDLMVVVEPGLTGGTFEAAKMALQLAKPLFVLTTAEDDVDRRAVEYFLRRGAFPLRFENGRLIGTAELVDTVLSRHKTRPT